MFVINNYKDVELKAINELKIIFANVNISCLTKKQIRYQIYKYLVENYKYDIELYTKIKSYNEKLKQNPKLQHLKRNVTYEFNNLINNRIGICSSISQYYKLLLELVKIKSACIICDDGTSVRHQLNVIYDDDTNEYSLDDVTFGIVNKNSEIYFNYDIETAHKYNQGINSIQIQNVDYKWLRVDESYINLIYGRSKTKNPINIHEVTCFLTQNDPVHNVDLDNDVKLR